jgi:large subunit ribosomal protein L35
MRIQGTGKKPPFLVSFLVFGQDGQFCSNAKAAVFPPRTAGNEQRISPCVILSEASWGGEVPVRLLTWGNLGGHPNSTKATKSQGEGKVQTRKRMPKLKTHTGAKKRFSKTGTGKIKRGQTKTRHILTSKPPKVKRKLGRQEYVSDGDYKKVARMIPYA